MPKLNEEPAGRSAGITTADGKSQQFVIRLMPGGYTNRKDRKRRKKGEPRPRLRIDIREIVDKNSLGLDPLLYDLDQSAANYAYIKRQQFLAQLRYMFIYCTCNFSLSVSVDVYDGSPPGRLVSVVSVLEGSDATQPEPADADKIRDALDEVSAMVFGHKEPWARTKTEMQAER